MAYTTIKKPSDYFNTKLYTGNGSTGHAITGVEHQPDLTWIKSRGNTEWHTLIDSVRGVTKYINSNDAGAERTSSNFIESFDSNGFTLGSANDTNQNSINYASWSWKANGAGSANTDGSISSTVSANTTSGFSIVKYTGTGSAGATVGHGLGVKPAMIIFKCLSVGGPSWVVYHQSKGATYTLYLNETSAGGTSAEMLNNTEPTSSLITLGNGTSSNSSGASTIAYCFADVQGFSKFGSYTGNGSTDGTFVYTGFKPAWVMVKCTSTTESWDIKDNKRNPFNTCDNGLRANQSSADDINTTYHMIDYLSNGFKLRGANQNLVNGSGQSYIYMAFAEQPLVGDNPATAR